MPLLSLSIFTLVGFFVLGSTNITLDTWIGASVSIISPLPLLFLGFKCFLTILTPSTITLESNILVIFPSLPLFEPETTTTLSPVLVSYYILLTSYNTSLAKLTILVNSLSLSSRATGPKIRVPTGLLSSLIITHALSSNLI